MKALIRVHDMYETLLLEQSLRVVIRERDELKRELDLLKEAAFDVACSNASDRDVSVQRLLHLLGVIDETEGEDDEQ